MPFFSISNLVGFSIKWAYAVFAACGLLFGLSVYYAATHFSISTDTSQLIAADVPWRKLETAFDRAFPSRVGLTLVVVDAPAPEQASRAADELEIRLKGNKAAIKSVRRPDASTFFARNGLLFLSQQDLAEKSAQLLKAQPFLGVLAADPSLRGLAQTFSLMSLGVREKETTFEAIGAPMQSFTAALEAASRGETAAFSWQELLTGAKAKPAELRRLILVQPILDFADLEPGRAAAAVIRQAASDLGLTAKNGYRVRLTGPVPLADEEFATVADGALANGIGTVLVVLFILWMALRSARIILAVFICLAAGMAMTAAAGLMLVETLNLISVAFAVLFVGLGVDFGLQFSVRYREERHGVDNVTAALTAAAAKSGTPLLLAAAATAAGFYSFLPTDYRGISELGLIAGTGMMIAFGTSVTLLPALLDRLRPPPEPVPMGYAFLAPVDQFLARRRTAVLIATAVVSLGGLPFLAMVQFDFNPLNLRSRQAESVSAFIDLMQDPATSPNTIDILSPGVAEATALAKKLEQLPQVEQVITLASFVPPDQEAKLAQIQDLSILLSPTLYPPEVLKAPADAEVVAALGKAADDLLTAASEPLTPGAGIARRLAQAMTALAVAAPGRRVLAGDILLPGFAQVLAQTRDALKAEPVAIGTLPPELTSDWLTPAGQARLEIFAKGNTNDNAVLKKFVDSVRDIAPQATGTPVSIQESGKTIVHAFLVAGAFALISIAALLYLVLRRIGDVVLTLVPLILAGVVTLEICGAAGLPLNFANIIALPLLLGIGVAFKIYFVMAWRAGETGLLQSSLTRAVFFSAMTTATAFGSLWLSKHPGTSSMGRLLALSLVTTLAAAVLFQPALMGPPRSKDRDAR